MAVRTERDSDAERVPGQKWAEFGPQLESALINAGVTGTAAVAKELARRALFGLSVATGTNLLIAGAIGTIHAGAEIIKKEAKMRRQGASAFKSFWHQECGRLGRVVNLPEHLAVRMVYRTDGKIKRALRLAEEGDEAGAYLLLRQVQLLTDQFRYVDAELTTKANGKLRDLTDRVDTETLNKEAYGKARRTYRRAVYASSLLSGAKVAGLSLVGIYLSEGAIAHLAERFTSSASIKEVAGQINETRSHLDEVIDNNQVLSSLRGELSVVNAKLGMASSEISKKLASVHADIAHYRELVSDYTQKLSRNQLDQQRLKDTVAELTRQHKAIVADVTTTHIEYVEVPSSQIPGSTIIQLLQENSPSAIQAKGLFPTLLDATTTIAEHQPGFFSGGYQMAKTLVRQGYDLPGALGTVRRMESLKIILSDGTVNVNAIKDVVASARSGNKESIAAVFDLLRWFNTNSLDGLTVEHTLRLPKTIVDTVRTVAEQQAEIQAQIDITTGTLTGLRSKGTELAKSLADSKIILTNLLTQESQLAAFAAPGSPEAALMQHALDLQSRIDRLTGRNTELFPALRQGFSKLFGFDISPETADTQTLIDLRNQLDATRQIVAAMIPLEVKIDGLLKAEAIASGAAFVGSAALAWKATNNRASQEYSAKFHPDGGPINLWDDISVTI